MSRFIILVTFFWLHDPTTNFHDSCSRNNLSGVVSLLHNLGQMLHNTYYVEVADFGMKNCTLAQAWLLNCNAMFLGEIIPCC